MKYYSFDFFFFSSKLIVGQIWQTGYNLPTLVYIYKSNSDLKTEVVCILKIPGHKFYKKGFKICFNDFQKQISLKSASINNICPK